MRGEDVTGASQIRYTVTGANQIAETTVNGRTATTFTITTDGTSTITAQAVSSTGNVSETSTQTLSKDATPPSTASIAVSGEPEETSITVTANGQDATSGIESYEFQRSTTSEKDGFESVNTVSSNENTCTYKYEGLTSGTTYYLRVVVKDRAGKYKRKQYSRTAYRGRRK